MRMRREPVALNPRAGAIKLKPASNLDPISSPHAPAGHQQPELLDLICAQLRSAALLASIQAKCSADVSGKIKGGTQSNQGQERAEESEGAWGQLSITQALVSLHHQSNHR